jgi:hypothetical protein
MSSPPPAQVRHWAQEIREATDMLYPPDAVARTDQVIAGLREGATTGAHLEARHEAGLRRMARTNLLAIANRLEYWASLVEHQQGQGRP